MIRIIGGEFRGRKLKVPSGTEVRPTSDRVRESLFNMLSPLLHWQQRTVLDLYAGSGALGFEALSRGASKVFFVETLWKHKIVIEENIQKLSLEKTKFELIQNQAEQFLSQLKELQQTCVIFIDPPYASDEYEPILNKIATLAVIPAESTIVVESSQSRKIVFPSNFERVKNRQYGAVKLDILVKKDI